MADPDGKVIVPLWAIALFLMAVGAACWWLYRDTVRNRAADRLAEETCRAVPGNLWLTTRGRAYCVRAGWRGAAG